jgi:hypothetical protein
MPWQHVSSWPPDFLKTSLDPEVKSNLLVNRGKLNGVRTIQSSDMQSAGIGCIVLFCTILMAGCIQLPGMHSISNSPDPVIGQWIGGEPPASDQHMIFYENQTFQSVNFFLNNGETINNGTWVMTEQGRYATQSVTGKKGDWRYDSFDDSIYERGLPLMKYHRYKG